MVTIKYAAQTLDGHWFYYDNCSVETTTYCDCLFDTKEELLKDINDSMMIGAESIPFKIIEVYTVIAEDE